MAKTAATTGAAAPPATAATAAATTGAAAPPATPAGGPAPATRSLPTGKNDPVEIQLIKSKVPTAAGAPEQYNIFARVLNGVDKGIDKKIVTFICEGAQLSDMTDKDGNAVCPFNPLIAPVDGKELRISAHVSGIRDLSVMHIIQRVVKTPAQIAKDAKNNKRAKWFLGFTAGLLVICLFFVIPIWGSGKPLIDPAKVSLMPHQQALSAQQVSFNNLPGVKGSELEIKPESAPAPLPAGKWQKPLFLIVFLWALFSILYWIFAWREEAVEAFRRGSEKFIDKHQNTANARDPLLQRLSAFLGNIKTTRRSETASPAATGITPGGATPITPTKNSFWELLRSDLLSDFAMEILPKIFGAVFKR